MRGQKTIAINVNNGLRCLYHWHPEALEETLKFQLNSLYGKFAIPAGSEVDTKGYGYADTDGFVSDSNLFNGLPRKPRKK